MEKRLQNDLVEAMKEHQGVRLDAIRAIKSEIQLEKTKGSSHELDDNEVIKIIQRVANRYKDDIEHYKLANRNDLVEKAEAELSYIVAYLPAKKSEEDVKQIIDNIIDEISASSMKDMGSVMKKLSETIPNEYDPKFASAYIKGILTSK